MSQTVEQTESKLKGLQSQPCPLCKSADAVKERVVSGYQLERCSQCRLVFMNPRCTPEHLEEIYTVRDEDELIELYARIASSTVLKGYDEKLQWLEKQVPTKGRLLDFACAAGYFFEVAQKRGWDAHGCDVGHWAARATQQRGVKNMHVGLIENLDFPDNHFDVVYAAQVFEHLLFPHDELKQLRRILKPGGLLYIDVPNYNTLPIRFNKDDFMLNDPPQHINYFTPVTLRKLLHDGGMEQIRLSTEGGVKWENLLGRPIESDIASAYGLTDEGEAAKPSVASRLKSGLKEVVKSVAVNPILYRGLKVGMNLASISRKPA